MSVNHLKLAGAAGAAALTVGLVAAPALAAGEETADVNYTCTTTLGLTPHPSAHYAVDAPPSTMVAGQKVSLPTTGTVTLDATTSGAVIQNFGWAQFDATIVTPTTGSTVGQNLTVDRTAMAPLGSPTTANLHGSTLLRPTKAGTFTLNLGNLGAASGLPAGAVTLKGYDGTGTLLNTAVFPDGGAFGQCTNDATKTALEDSTAAPATVTVTKDSSTTKVTAAYNAKTDVATGTATVKGKVGGLAGTGKVSFTLKKGTHTIKTVAGTLKKGVAKASFSGVKKAGTYSITAKFSGDAALNGSSGKASFTVK